MHLKLGFLLFCALFFINHAATSELVPVYMWETKKEVLWVATEYRAVSKNMISLYRSSDIPAINHINTATFKEILLQESVENTFVIVFAEQNLSPEDFIEQDGVRTFSNLAEVSEKVSYLPLVEKPIDAINELFGGDVAEVSVQAMLDNLNVPKSKVLIVHLNDAKDDENRINMLKRHDENVVTIYKNALKQHENVLAIFTGYHLSWIVPEEIRSKRQSRSILAEGDESTETFLNSSSFLMYLSGAAQIVYSDRTVNLTEITLKEGENSSYSISSKDSEEITFTFDFPSGYWKLVSLTVGKVEMVPISTFVPQQFSYHCSSGRFVSKPSEDKTKIVLILPGLQIQPFLGENRDSNTYGDAYDCVGFTTAPIWSGLFITFILAMIMTIGLVMMLDIKTMDRFDDPKGKTITVTATD